MDLDPYIAATNLQKVVVEALEKYCLRKKICDRSRPEWSPRAGELLTGCKRARRQFQRTRSTLDAVEWKQLRNQLQQEMRRNSRTRWRKLVTELIENPSNTSNRGLWRLSKWSRSQIGVGPTIIPPIRETEEKPLYTKNEEKAEILRAKFFPAGGQADLSDIDNNQESPQFQINTLVTEEELSKVLSELPSNKAPGPDQILNEVWKVIYKPIQKELAQTFTRIL